MHHVSEKVSLFPRRYSLGLLKKKKKERRRQVRGRRYSEHRLKRDQAVKGWVINADAPVQYVYTV